MLEALGYKQNTDFTYDGTLEFAAQIGLIGSSASISTISSFTIDNVSKGIYKTLKTNVKNEDKKLLNKLTDSKAISIENAVAAGFEVEVNPVNVVSFKAFGQQQIRSCL